MSKREEKAPPVHVTPNNELEQKIMEAFEVFDHSGKQVVDVREIGTILRSLGCCPTEADIQEVILRTESKEATGNVSLHNFMPYMSKAMMEHRFYPASAELLLAAFRYFDPEGRGFLTKERFTKLMMEEGEPFTQEEFDEMMQIAVDPVTDTIMYEYYINQLMDLTECLQSKQKPHCGQCTPDETRNTVNIIISNACDEAALGREPAPRVYNRALITLKNQGLHLASSIVPEFREIKSRIYRKRNKLAHVKKIKANTVKEVEVPSIFSDFLLADFRQKKMRILVFGSSDAREIIKKVKHFFMDGTFKSCPRSFQQLFTIHGDVGSDTNNTNVIPLVYAFMSHRTKKAYSILFDLIASQIPEWKPNKVTIDFEEGTMKALQKMNVTVKGCYYHYVNSLWRKAKTLGLSKDKRNRRIISLCANLALLPVNEFVSGWVYIQNEMIENSESMMKFKKYFDNYWMKNDFHRIWSDYGERRRTNNAVEGWHHKINNLVTKGQVNLLQILHILQDDSVLSSYRIDILQRPSTSNKRSKRRKIDVFNDDYIIDAQMQLTCGQINVGHFLEKLR